MIVFTITFCTSSTEKLLSMGGIEVISVDSCWVKLSVFPMEFDYIQKVPRFHLKNVPSPAALVSNSEVFPLPSSGLVLLDTGEFFTSF
jgi:hypothetical protein